MPITVQKLIDLTKVLMFEKKNSKDYDNYELGNINMLLSENFSINNGMREFKGKDPMNEIPFVMSKEDNIEYEDRMCYEVLPAGLAAFFFADDNMARYSAMYTQYMNARMSCVCGVPVKIKNRYGETS